MDNEETGTRITKRRPIVAGLILVALFAVSWVHGHAFIEVTASGDTGSLSYELLDQGNEKKKTYTQDNRHSFKKLVAKGNYEVTVRGGQTGSFNVVAAKAFLRTTKVQAELKPEASRTFIGNDPGPCMHYNGTQLYSYVCSGNYSDMQAHLPASTESPTTTFSPPVGVGYPIGGVINLDGKDFVLLKVGGFEEQPRSELFPLKSDLSLDNGIDLKGLNSADTYNIRNFRDGFIVYKENYSQIFYYTDPFAEPQKISVKAPSDASLKPSGLSTHDDRIAIAYSTPREGNQDDNAPQSGQTVIEVLQYPSWSTRSYAFDSGYTSMKLCGSSQLCFINSRLLEVYKLDGDNADKQFEVINVRYIENQGNSVAVIRDHSVVTLNLDTRSGPIQYSFASYNLCGSQAAFPSGYVLCLINKSNNRVALYIDPSQKDDTRIDQKISNMLGDPLIDNLSVYKNVIYVTPYVGEPVYNESTNSYSYSPDIIKRSNNRINQLFSENRLTSPPYTIINPYVNY